MPRRIVEKRIVAVRIPERRLHRRGALLLDLAVAWRPAATPGSGLVGVDRLRLTVLFEMCCQSLEVRCE